MSVSIDLDSTFLSAESQGGTDERQAAGCFAGEQFVYALTSYHQLENRSPVNAVSVVCVGKDCSRRVISGIEIEETYL